MTKRWIKGKKKEYYYRRAKAEGYRSRAAYKLIQLNKKYRILKVGDRILDLGAAPGGWMQVARKLVGERGFVLGVDLVKIEPFEYKNVASIEADLFSEDVTLKIKEVMPVVDVVLSDASPDISGVWSMDHLKSVDLCSRALGIADELLKPGGNMLVKIFQGEEAEDLFGRIKSRFEYAKMTKPKASRGRSAEMYIVGKGFIKQIGPGVGRFI